MANNTGDNISAVLGLDGLDEVDESTLPDAGTDEANNLEDGYDLTEPPTADDDTPDDEGTPPAAGRKQLVPLGALQEERTKRQNYERELEESRNMQARMQERFNEMMMRLQGVQKEAPPPEEDVIPDFLEDPQGHVEGLKRQFSKQLAELQGQVQQTQGQTQQQAQHQQLAQTATAAENAFRSTAPDYDVAAEHFKAVKLAEYQAFGLDEVAAAQQLARDCTGIVQGATQKGKNPAEVLYNLAKALGYRPQAAQQQQQQKQAPQQRPKAPTSLANVSGAAKAPDEDNGGEMSLEKVANMSDKEFDKFFAEQQRGTIQRPKF